MLKERKGLYPRGRWDLHTKSIWKGGLKKWPLNGNQITLGYTQLDIFKYEFMNHWKEGCTKWPLKGKQITGRGIFSVVLTRRGYTGHRTQLWTYSTHSKFSRIDLNSNSLNLSNNVCFLPAEEKFRARITPTTTRPKRCYIWFLHKQRVPFLR